MVKKRVIEKISDTREKINLLDFDAHWYRRVFHTFGASFVVYYMVPDIGWINILKLIIPALIVLIAISLEILRIKGYVSSSHFFGLRMYEKKRIGSYVFFGIGILILLLFFPQQIAIPCILCACLADPIIGEIRNRFSKKYVYIVGFLICTSFFVITWHNVQLNLLLLVSLVGGGGAIIGEAKKFYWIDDDFMVQILPAILLGIIWISIPYLGLNYPDMIIHPFNWPW